jgi:hypothetical protein
MPSRIPATFLLGLCLCLLAVACGGGGSGAGTGGGSPPGGSDAVTRQVLEACLLLGLDEAQDFAMRFVAVIQGQGAAAGFSIAGGGVQDTPDDLRIEWEYDPNMDMVPDATGDLTFLDGMSMPTQPFAQMHIDALKMNGIDALGAALASAPDGTVLRVVWNGPLPGLITGELDVPFNAGLPGTTTGRTAFFEDPGGCESTFSWDGPTLAALTAAFPTGGFQLLLQSGGDTVQGTLQTNGTASATLVVSRNGGNDESWNFGLDTGLATAP